MELLLDDTMENGGVGLLVWWELDIAVCPSE